MKKEKKEFRNPWAWVSTLYYAQGIPYVVAMTVSVILYKRLGVSNTDIALYTSWLYLPWVIKPLWSPIVDMFKTKRFWTISMQFIVGAGLAGVAFTIPVDSFFQYTLAFFWLIAFASATHDIAADGFYMLALDQGRQSMFVGIRSAFYRAAMITGQGLLVILAGYFESSTGLPEVKTEVNSLKSSSLSYVDLYEIDLSKFQKLSDELYFTASSEKINISIQNVDKKFVDSVLNLVKELNRKNGFYKEIKISSEENTTTVQTKKASESKTSFITSIENFIRENFWEKKKEVEKTKYAGNIGIIYYRLSREPKDNQELPLIISKASGDNSIQIIEGTRFTFTKDNWNKPAFAVFQLDPKLKYETKAKFVGRSGNIQLAWKLTFLIIAGLFILFFIYHYFILPYPSSDKATIDARQSNPIKEFFNTFALFFKKKKIWAILLFLLFYRFAEAQLVKLASPFLLDSREVGGLGLTTGEVGIVYGTVGILALTFGGILGGLLAAKDGLKKWLLWMVLAITLPNLAFVYLSYYQPENFIIINICVAFEQFGYGFGFTAYMLYLIYSSEGDHKTAHYAIGTGFMALSMMLPGMFSGWLQELIGYKHFFLWVMICSLPTFIVAYIIPLDPNFGKKKKD